MGDVKRRVAKLEGELGADDGCCQCKAYALRVEYDAESWPYEDRQPPDPGPLVCPECGKPRITFVVTYDRSGDANAE